MSVSEEKTRAPFESIGEKARWRLVYPLLASTPVNGVVTFEQAASALALEVEDNRAVVRQALLRAGRELLRKDGRAIDSERGVGYRIVPAVEHLRLAQRKEGEARRKIRTGGELVRFVDMAAVPVEDRPKFEVMVARMGAVEAMLRSHNLRIARQEEINALVVPTVVAHDGRMTAVEQELAELREKLSPAPKIIPGEAQI